MSIPTISIVLAACDGGRYLRQQLASLSGQTLLPGELIVGDDGSQDDTCKIVEEFAASSPFPVRLVRSAGSRLGTSGNFARLLELAGGDYLMFCDQDDIWFPDKVQVTLKEMRRLEGVYGLYKPCIVYTDLKIAAEDGTEIAPSFWRYQRIRPPEDHLRVLLVQNVATGCTMMVNRAALRLVMPMPLQVPLMHDWWFALAVAACGGHISGLDYATMLYRQHGCNVVGARAWWRRILTRLVGGAENIRKELRATQEQAAGLLCRHGNDIPQSNKAVVQSYARLAEYGFWARKMLLARHGIHKLGWYRTVSLYLYA